MTSGHYTRSAGRCIEGRELAREPGAEDANRLAGGPRAGSADQDGIAETQPGAGLYDLLDELRRRHPDLGFEGGRGGRRRGDPQILSRFRWHRQSDRWFVSVSHRCGMAAGGSCGRPRKRS